MTGIADLSAVFGSSARVSDTDGDAMSLGGTSADTGASAVSESNQSFLNSDQTVVSFTGGAMLQAMSASDVRTDKVASLQAAIANGSYNVSSQDVAAKLVDSMLGKG